MSRRPRPLPRTSLDRRTGSPLVYALFLLIEHQAKHIEAKLGVLETHAPELLLCLVAQDVAPGGPERSNGFANGLVVWRRVAVHVARERDLAARRAVDAVDLALRKRLELVDAEFLRQSVHARVPQELVARFVEFGDRRVVFEPVCCRGAAREVFACVLILEEGGDGFYGIAFEGNAALYVDTAWLATRAPTVRERRRERTGPPSVYFSACCAKYGLDMRIP